MAMRWLGQRLALGLGIALMGRTVAADRAIDAAIFKPALDSQGLFSIERAQAIGEHDIDLRVAASFGQDPLKLDTLPGPDGAPSGKATAVLDYQLVFHFGFAIGISDRLTAAFDVPVQLQPLGEGYGAPGRYAPVDPEDAKKAHPGTGFFSVREEQNVQPSENTPGDCRLGMKYRRGSVGPLDLAAQAVVYVPFGDEDVFGGSAGFTFEPKLIAELGIGERGFVAMNAAARIRDGSLASTRRVSPSGLVDHGPDGMPSEDDRFPRLYVGTEALLGTGGLYRVTPHLALAAEAYALIPIDRADSVKCNGQAGCKNGDLTGDLVVGTLLSINPDLNLSMGAGAGIVPGAARSDSFRLLAELRWSPSPATSGRGRGDSDRDRVADGVDACPQEPEDADGFQDDDGCPELDNDLDGILDAHDRCPSEPEDQDGHEDTDGCPEGDNDKDGVPDLADRCPDEAEDGDRFQDDDGCPDEDNDGDGILDQKDGCPNEAESVNGYQDLDGCPDQGVTGGPRLVADRIDLQGERVDFVGRSAQLTRASLPIMDVVAQVMMQNRQIRFRIEVSVETSGTTQRHRQADAQLSQERAEAVRRYLVEKGVNPVQLDVHGLGSDFPLDRSNPKDPRNRRVEFIRTTQ